jgi:hypothetical protein
LTEAALGPLSQWVNNHTDLMLWAFKDRLAQKLSIQVTEKAVSRALTKIGFMIKLLHVILAARNCQATIQDRWEYAEHFLGEGPPDQRNIVWINEYGFNLHICHRQTPAQRGE